MATGPILQGLVTLADKILALRLVFDKTQQENRDRLADYCDKIADTLSRAYLDLENGKTPHGCCYEMDSYMKDLRRVLDGSLSAKDLADLQAVLAVSYEVEYLDRELPPQTRRGSRYAELDMAAGKFRAVGSMLRATRR